MVAPDDIYTLPCLLAQQYVLTDVHHETPDAVFYSAVQKDTQRNVLVCSLRGRFAADSEVCERFFETARSASRLHLPSVSAVLEIFEAWGTWHLVFEGNGSQSLDFLLLEGRKLNSEAMAHLLGMLCRLCLYLDAENINALPFSLNSVYLDASDFVLDNPAVAGRRDSFVSNRFIIDAARALLPLLDLGERPHSALVRQLMLRVAEKPDTCPLVASELLCELVRLPDDSHPDDVLL